MTTVVALIAILVLCIGLAMLIANPTRLTNRVFAFGSLLLAIELFAIYKSIESGIQFQTDGVTRPLVWLRASGFIAPLFPWFIWLLIESIIPDLHPRYSLAQRSLLFLFPALLFCSISLTEWYIPSTSNPTRISYGKAYYTQTFALILSYFCLTARSLRLISKQSGIRRIETQLLALNLSATSAASASLLLAGNAYGIYNLKKAGLLILLISFCITAGTLSAYRIFTLRQIGIRLLHYISITGLFYCVIIIFIGTKNPISSIKIETQLGLCILCVIISWIDRNSIDWLGIEDSIYIKEIKQNAVIIAKQTEKREDIVTRLEDLLRHSFKATAVNFLFPENSSYKSNNISISNSTKGYATLHQLGWITPESLERRRPSPSSIELSQILDKYNIGLMLTVPQESPQPSIIVTLGVREGNIPYTYPEIKRIQEIAELMDNLLVRSQLSAQLELEARFESLAIMSRGLAHDLKNLITPVATFLNTYESKQKPCGEEDSVYAAAHRSMRVISDYVEETHFFSKQMVPRLEPVNPVELMRDVALALRAKADRESVTLEVGLSTEEVIRADRVLLLRLLSNLVDNAIDASTPGCRVCLHARWGHDGHMKISVIDSGAGISSDILPRIFEPYFTTKDRGTSLRGFGLGLAICQKIVEIHGGKIGVRTAPGAGTTFEVSIPKGEAQPHLGTDPETALATRIPPVPAAA